MLTYRRTLPPSLTFPLRYNPDIREYKRYRGPARNNATNNDRHVRGERLFSGYQARKCMTSVTGNPENSYTYHAAEETGDSI